MVDYSRRIEGGPLGGYVGGFLKAATLGFIAAETIGAEVEVPLRADLGKPTTISSRLNFAQKRIPMVGIRGRSAGWREAPHPFERGIGADEKRSSDRLGLVRRDRRPGKPGNRAGLRRKERAKSNRSG